MTDEKQDELPIVPSRKSKWGAWEYGLLSAGIIVVGIAIGGPIYWHSSNKNNAVKKATAPLKTEVKKLQGERTTLDSALRITVTNLKSDYEKEVRRIEEGSKKEIATLEGKVRSVYEDSLREVYQSQFSKYPAEIRNFIYKFETGEEGRVYLDIEPVSGKPLRDIVKTIIPENIDQRAQFAKAVKGFFDKYTDLAREYRLSPDLNHYTAVHATPRRDGVWNIVFVDKDKKQISAQYWPGGE